MTPPGEAWCVRSGAQRLVERAARAGMSGAWALLSRTPREIDTELCAWAERRRRQREDMEILAWRMGGYAMVGVHAPKRYPRRPNVQANRARRMTDGEMKRAFAAMAAGREENHGGG